MKANLRRRCWAGLIKRSLWLPFQSVKALSTFSTSFHLHHNPFFHLPSEPTRTYRLTIARYPKPLSEAPDDIASDVLDVEFSTKSWVSRRDHRGWEALSGDGWDRERLVTTNDASLKSGSCLSVCNSHQTILLLESRHPSLQEIHERLCW